MEWKIQSNRHEILLGFEQNTKKLSPHILGRGKEKHGGLCHKKLPTVAPNDYATKILETKNKINRKLKIPEN